ncbi:MAG TPA: NADH-quinone oxidoreductase subunit M [Thermoanaerobaculia bacterium]|nr:NADH-quinone oxidoreductase subunit M [Thermoanaerobaculia bacterium]
MESFLALAAGNTLTRLVLFPAVASLPLLFLRRDQVTKVYLLVVSLIEVALTFLYLGSHGGADGIFSLTRDLGPDGKPLEWIPRFGIRFDLVADGISWPLAVLAVLLVPVVLLGSWKGIEKKWPAYGASLLWLTSGVLGALFAYDLFLFYIFWEVMLVPMYLIIGVWGGERRIYAAVKFFLFTMAGSLLMLIAILWLVATYARVAGTWSFAYEDLLRLDLPLGAQMWLFAGFALAFLIKVPMFPVHTWLPDAHVEAPTGGSVILAGILLKLGTYGYLRFAMPLFPQASDAAQPLLLTLALIGILYGALVAWVQTDMKKLVAYSSVAHLGFVMLGLLAADLVAWQGALLQMINHGLSTGALFLLVGMLYDRRHTKKFEEFGGLAKPMPVFAFFLVFSTLASVGLPLLNGFVGEFMILLGAYRTTGFWAVAATFGVVLAAIYLFKMLQLTLWGPITKEENRKLPDLSLREILSLAPLAVLMLVIGVAPAAFLKPSEKALAATLTQYQERLKQTPATEARLLPQEMTAALPRGPVVVGEEVER